MIAKMKGARFLMDLATSANQKHAPFSCLPKCTSISSRIPWESISINDAQIILKLTSWYRRRSRGNVYIRYSINIHIAVRHITHYYAFCYWNAGTYTDAVSA